jgi:DNA-3-methyladenine glycosylase II
LNTHQNILDHLKQDAILHKAILKLGREVRPELNIDIYHALLSSIVSQQLSTKVVKVIWKRFTDLFVDGYPTAEALLAKEHELLRKVGLSNNKVRYVKNVAEFKMSHDMSYDYFEQLTDEEIITYLTKIKGVGKWTVQMILMFPMNRPNVFPEDDLGIQNVMKSLYNIELEKKELKLKMNEIAEVWSPYRSIASKYLWEIGDKG